MCAYVADNGDDTSSSYVEIITGTPSGVGAFRDPPVYLKPGDQIEIEIEGIGVLSNPVAGSD